MSGFLLQVNIETIKVPFQYELKSTCGSSSVNGIDMLWTMLALFSVVPPVIEQRSISVLIVISQFHRCSSCGPMKRSTPKDIVMIHVFVRFLQFIEHKGATCFVCSSSKSTGWVSPPSVFVNIGRRRQYIITLVEVR
jgi:hypothetical protein